LTKYQKPFLLPLIAQINANYFTLMTPTKDQTRCYDNKPRTTFIATNSAALRKLLFFELMTQTNDQTGCYDQKL